MHLQNIFKIIVFFLVYFYKPYFFFTSSKLFFKRNYTVILTYIYLSYIILKSNFIRKMFEFGHHILKSQNSRVPVLFLCFFFFLIYFFMTFNFKRIFVYFPYVSLKCVLISSLLSVLW